MAGTSRAQRAGERDRVIGLLRTRAADLREQWVCGVALFGSIARDEARPASEVDLLVDLDRQTRRGLGVVGLRGELDRLFGRRVGLAFMSRLRPKLRMRIERDMMRVF